MQCRSGPGSRIWWGDQLWKTLGGRDNGEASVGKLHGAVRAAEGGGKIHLQNLPGSREVKSGKCVRGVMLQVGIRLLATLSSR
jgi:hypothetical protein